MRIEDDRWKKPQRKLLVPGNSGLSGHGREIELRDVTLQMRRLRKESVSWASSTACTASLIRVRARMIERSCLAGALLEPSYPRNWFEKPRTPVMTVMMTESGSAAAAVT